MKLNWLQIVVPAVVTLFVYLYSSTVTLFVYWYSTTFELRHEEQHGKARLRSICHRYVLNFWNAYDHQTRQLRRDDLAYRLYTEELQHIMADLDSLLENAYVEKLLLEYPQVSMLTILVRREYIEHTINGSPLRAMNADTLNRIFELLHVTDADGDFQKSRQEFDANLRTIEDGLRAAGMLPSTQP